MYLLFNGFFLRKKGFLSSNGVKRKIPFFQSKGKDVLYREWYMGGCRHAISLRVFDPIAYEWVIEFNTRRKISISMLPTREVVFINEWKKIGDARLKMKNALNHYSTRNNGHNFQFTKLSVLDFFPSTEAIVSGTRPKSAFWQTRLPEVDSLGNVSAAY